MPRQTTMAFTRRHLPHWIPEETVVFVTWRLAGSLPVQARAPAAEQRGQTPFLQHDERLDLERSGPTWLQDSRVASIVANALLYGETVRRYYQLHAWVVMPNHVHAVFQPHTALPTIMQWLKGRTSRVANQILGRTGTPFRQDESFDHWIRSGEELQYLIEYVEHNPLKAGLVEAGEQWRWPSAGGETDDKNRSSVPLPK
jgi:REP element-mobilizing transposase RayT